MAGERRTRRGRGVPTLVAARSAASAARCGSANSKQRVIGARSARWSCATPAAAGRPPTAGHESPERWRIGIVRERRVEDLDGLPSTSRDGSHFCRGERGDIRLRPGRGHRLTGVLLAVRELEPAQSVHAVQNQSCRLPVRAAGAMNALPRPKHAVVLPVMNKRRVLPS